MNEDIAAAEFAGSMDRTPESTTLYARLIARIQQREALLPMDASAVGRLLEHAARMVSDQPRSTYRVGKPIRMCGARKYGATWFV